MNCSILTGAAALALVAAPAFAQDATTGDQATAPAADQAATTDQQMAAGDPQTMRDSAIQSAEGVGMTEVGDVAGAFVLQGTSPTGLPVLMVVGPAGELLALATPLAAAVTGVEPTAAETGAEPQAGEPAQEGFMATQTQPASPQMWDPEMVEGAMQGLGGGAAATTGEAPAQ